MPVTNAVYSVCMSLMLRSLLLVYLRVCEAVYTVTLACGASRVCAGSEFTPLMFAALNGHVSLVRLLLKHGADKEMLSAMGQKAVNIAWTVGREDIVKVREGVPSLHYGVSVIVAA